MVCFAASFTLLAMVALFFLTHSQGAVTAAAWVGGSAYCGAFAIAIGLIMAATVKRAPKPELKRAFRWVLAGNASFLVQAVGAFLWLRALA